MNLSEKAPSILSYSESDLNRDFARRAFYGTSHSPERRGDDAIKGYCNEMEVTAKEFVKYATPENEEELRADLEAYRLGYLEKYRAYLAAHSQVISVLVTGPANFPTQRNQKRCNTADRRAKEFLDWNEKTIKRLRQKYNPLIKANAPISSGDSEAIIKLQAKIEQAEATQELMKKANAIIRKNLPDNETVAALIKLGIKEGSAWKLLQPDYLNRKGFADYQLKNNNANIRRMKGRIEQLEREVAKRAAIREAVAAEIEEEAPVNGVRIVENFEANRLQILFPGKPAGQVITRLKSNGFKWAPSQGCWQRLLNDNARAAAANILNSI